MSDKLVHEIHQVVSNYIDQPDEVDRFVEAFNTISFNVHKKGDHVAAKLADHIEGLLADVRAGFSSLHDFQTLLRDIVAPAPVAYYYAASVGGFSQSVNQPAVLETAFPVSASFSGTSAAVVFGSANPFQKPAPKSQGKSGSHDSDGCTGKRTRPSSSAKTSD